MKKTEEVRESQTLYTFANDYFHEQVDYFEYKKSITLLNNKKGITLVES
jgi:hypothetical protein